MFVTSDKNTVFPRIVLQDLLVDPATFQPAIQDRVTLNETKRKCFSGTIFSLVQKKKFLMVSFSIADIIMRGNEVHGNGRFEN